MDPLHRKRIDALIDVFAYHVDMIILWPFLLQQGIFNHDDCNIPEWSKDIANPATIRDIMLTIKTRGPNAYKNLILSLRLLGHVLLADVLALIK